MIDLKALRDDPEIGRRSQRLRGEDESLVDRVIAAEERHRALLTSFESMRAEQKALSRTIGTSAPEERAGVLAKAKRLAQDVKDAEQRAAEARAELDALLLEMPNIVIDGVPGGGEDDYTVLRHVGTPPTFDFEPKDHLEIGEGLRAIDMARGAKVSGSRFHYLTGYGARLQWALLSAAVDAAVANGFVPVVTPTLVKPEIMRGTGFLGAHSDEVYHLPADDLYLVGTSEVALAGYHSDEIVDLSDGPLRYAGISSCYRREAGAAGRDNRGIVRVHQFDKIEMFSYCRVEDAEEEHLRLLAWQEEMLGKIDVAYRIIDTAAGDLGSSAARKYDLEAWLPSQGVYRELTSTSNCTTYQARRLGVRERNQDGSTRTVATLNGTLATTRWLVAILENHQRADGSVAVPEGLRPYMGGLEELRP